MKKKKAYVYTRVSTSMQVDGYSLEAQEERIKQYANAYNIEIINRYQDAGKSGKSIIGRNEFMMMLSDIEAEKDSVDYVLVFKLSRFGRNAADTLKSLEIMENHDVNLICVDDGLDSSKDSGKLVITILSAVAEMERENILSQTMEGRKQKAREGKWNGGFAPIGYSLKDGKLYINEEEAEPIRKIFDMYVNTDMGANGIAKHLVNLNMKKPIRQNGNSPYFSAYLIRQILDNPVYNGKIAYGRRKGKRDKTTGKNVMIKSDNYILSEGIHEALIDDETWEKARSKRKSQAKRYEKVNKGKDEKAYLLSSIVKCPICGAGLYGNKSRKKNKNKEGEYYKDYYYYACKHRKLIDGHKCNFSKQIKIESLDREVLAIISQIVSNPTFADRIEKKINVQTDTKEIDKIIKKYESKLRQLNATKINLIKQIDTLDFEDRNYESKYKDLNLRLDNTYDQLADIEDLIRENKNKRELILKDKMTSDNVYKILINFDSLLNVMEDVDKKRLCSLLIDEIQLYEEKQENGQWIKSLSFKLPIIEEDINISLDNKSHVETVALLTKLNK
ncbi:recombinase family protein [Facklamia sp. P12950]|uniref:recombinase family protein n=1 Tax=Facklamia sp. P12950 TaxID=3421951 RepID=UPI003D17EEE0